MSSPRRKRKATGSKLAAGPLVEEEPEKIVAEINLKAVGKPDLDLTESVEGLPKKQNVSKVSPVEEEVKVHAELEDDEDLDVSTPADKSDGGEYFERMEYTQRGTFLGHSEFRQKNECKHCPAVFTHHSSLARHVTTQHPEVREQMNVKRASPNMMCLEMKCEFRARNVGLLRKHLEEEHGIKFTILNRSFENWDEFLEWKNSIENWLNMNFVEPRGATENLQHEIKTYVCNRSGNYRPTGTGKRRSKSTGSVKIGRCCTATMRAKRDKYFGDVTVEACVNHYGHEMEIEHLRIPKLERDKLVGKIQMGIPMENILKDAQERRESVVPELTEDVLEVLEEDKDPDDEATKILKIYMMDKGYITNLEKSYGVKAVRLKPCRKRKPHAKSFTSKVAAKNVTVESANQMMRPQNVNLSEVESFQRERAKSALLTMVDAFDSLNADCLPGALEVVEQARDYVEDMLRVQEGSYPAYPPIDDALTNRGESYTQE